MTHRSQFLLSIATVFLMAFACTQAIAKTKTFRAGAFAMDITPFEFPVIINGGFVQQTADRVVTPQLDVVRLRCSGGRQ